MAKAKAGPVAADRLKSFIERVEKLMEERHAIQGDIRDVLMEAKGVGYDVKTMRKLINIRAMDAADRAEQEALLDTYMHALGMDTSANVIMPSEEELIERAARIINEVDRCLALVRAGKLPKIADIQGLVGCSVGKASKLRGLVAERISRSNGMTVKNENENPPHDPDTGEIADEMNPGAGAADAAKSAMAQAAAPTEEQSAVGLPPKHAAAVGAVLDAMAAGDDLGIPPFLDRRKQFLAAAKASKEQMNGEDQHNHRDDHVEDGGVLVGEEQRQSAGT